MSMEASTSDIADSVVEENSFQISMPFVVLRKILSYLPARDLGHAARVCHSWYDVCRIVRRGRQIIHWFEWHSPKVGRIWTLQSPRDQINEEFGRVFSEPTLCIFFSSKRTNCIKAYGGLKEAVLPNVYGVCFCEFSDERSPCNHVPVIRHLMAMVPRSCFTIGLTVYGTIGTPRDLNPTVESREKASLSMLMLPKITGVITRPFVVGMKNYLSVISGKSEHHLLSDEELNTLTGIPPEEEVKCLLFFCDSVDGEHAAQYIVNTLMERVDQKLAVGGGIAEDCDVNTSVHNPILMGVAISGESVRAVSTVIPERVSKISQIDEYIKKLKSCNVPSENCLAFMFTCMCRRRERHKGIKVTESSLFRTHFPSVPLVGFLASGEMGVDYLVPCDSQEGNTAQSDVDMVNEPLSKRYRKKSFEDITHQYSTVFVMVSLKKGKRRNVDD